METISPDEIIKAVDSGLLEVVYQPKVAISDSHKLVGVEAFFRLKNEQNKSLPPEQVLAQITDFETVRKITNEVISQACQAWHRWHHKESSLNISINLEQSLFANKKLASELAGLIDQYQVPRKYLTFEIAHATRAFSKQEIEQITRLRMKGFRVAIDDCGENALTNSEIANLPIDQLKLDRNITDKLPAHFSAREAARNLARLANRLGLDCIAVGVEKTAQVKWLSDNGYDVLQGFLFAPPLPPEGVEHFVVNQQQWKIEDKDLAHGLVVSNDDSLHSQMSSILDTHYRIFGVNISPQAISAAIAEFNPELIIVDGRNHKHTPADEAEVLAQISQRAFFVYVDQYEESNSLEWFDKGAIDVIPCDTNEVDLKIRLLRIAKSIERQQAYEHQARELQQAALGSMQEAAHYGDVVHFLKAILDCHDEHSIAQRLFKFIQQKSLEGAVQFRNGSDCISLSSQNQVCSPLEEQVFELLKDKGRVYDFNKYSIINDNHVSILLYRLPDDETERGRIRDYVAVVIEALEARYKDIMRRRALQTAFESLQTMAEDLRLQHEEDSRHKKEVLEKFNIDLQMSYHVLDLTEEQENHLNGIIERMLESQEEAEIVALATQDKLEDLVRRLAESIQNLEFTNVDDSADDDNDIELF